jgi:hypothetical protein
MGCSIVEEAEFTTESQRTIRQELTAELAESAERRLVCMGPAPRGHTGKSHLRALRELRGESSSKLCVPCASVVHPLSAFSFLLSAF